MSTKDVGFVRPEVSRLLDRWRTIRDCLDGAEAIRQAGDKYLPRPNPDDESKENRARYKAYLTRASWYGVLSHTHSRLIGQVFATDPAVDAPPILEHVVDHADGGGRSLAQQAREALGLVLAYGRCGLLVDFPSEAEGASLADVKSGRARPTISLYQPEQIINWRVQMDGANKVLTLLVLKEKYVKSDDGFREELGDQYRVFVRTESGVEQQLWRDENLSSPHTVIQVLDGRGSQMTDIPFVFIGSEDNDPDPDEPPMYDMAELNIGHWRNSADTEESSYMVGQPTPWVSGIDEDWLERVMGGKLRVGSRGGVPLPQGGAFGIAQVAPNMLPRELAQDKEKQMLALGARLTEPRGGQVTATEASLNEAGSLSVLALCAKNVSEAYTQALEICLLFLAATGEVSFDLNTDFEMHRMTAQDRAQLTAEWQSGQITTEEMRYALRRARIAYLTDDEFVRAIALESPINGRLPANEAEAQSDESGTEQ